MAGKVDIAVDDARLLARFTEEDAGRIRDNAPDELISAVAWVCSAREPRVMADGTVKSSKRPVSPVVSRSAKSDDPSTWGTFEQACRRALLDDKGYGICAIGVNLQGGPVVGLDLDHVLVDGELVPEARALLDALPATYTEVSPSGTGLRLFYLGRLPAAFRGSNVQDAFGEGTQLECYDGGSLDPVTGNLRGGRYLTVTGLIFEGRSTMAEVG